MVQPDEFKIHLTQEFEHLRHAPIVEAVIDFRARAEAPWDEETVGPRLKAAMVDYPKAEPQRGFSVTVQVNPTDLKTQSPTSSSEDLGWMGLRFTSKDAPQIASFTRDGFSLSRLHPYQNWDQLSHEALRLWEIHHRFACVSAIQRLGVRFINRMDAPRTEFRLEDYYQDFKIGTAGLPLEGFFHHDVLMVPGYPYGINLIRTFQPHTIAQSGTPALILDIDIFTREPIDPTLDIIQSRLAEMRWLKNHIFFTGVTKEVLTRCH